MGGCFWLEVSAFIKQGDGGMNRETLKKLIDLVPEKDIDLLYRLVVKFVPEGEIEPGEKEELESGRKDRLKNGMVMHENIKWN